MCVFFPFILDIKFVGRTVPPAGVTQEEGHTGFLIHLLSAVRAEKDSAIPFPRRPYSRILCTSLTIICMQLDKVNFYNY